MKFKQSIRFISFPILLMLFLVQPEMILGQKLDQVKWSPKPDYLLDTTIYPISTQLQKKEWPASWICVPGFTHTGYGVYHFRKIINLDSIPKTLIIHVSADNRYKLFINEKLVSLGPARGDLFHWYFESIDLTPYLKKGKNCIAAIVWNEGDFKAQAQISFRTGFILQAEGPLGINLNTNSSWHCLHNKAYKSYTPYRPGISYLTGPAECIDFTQFSAKWEALSYDDSQWLNAETILAGAPKGIFDWSDAWMLTSRMIPLPQLKEQRFLKIRLSEGLKEPFQLTKTPFKFTIPANSHVFLLVDQTFLTNAFAVLKFSGGNRAGISISYAESLFEMDEHKPNSFTGLKGNRNRVRGMQFMGKTDTLIASGDSGLTFTSLSYRTFRYIKLEIKTQTKPLQIDDFYGVYCAYPFEHHAEFVSNDTVLNKIFETGWRTARSCAVETYMDCPYYEQLQYIGDTRIQAMVSIYNSGDARLMRNSIEQLDYSRISEGITQSRYPAVHQLIPPFSLYWIGMLHDYYRYVNDKDFVKNKLDGSRQILEFFSRYQGKNFLLTHVPYWNFSDWAESKGWDRGVAPTDNSGYSSILDLQLLKAYELASILEKDLGDKRIALDYDLKVAGMKANIWSLYYSPSRQLFADNSSHTSFSQHAASLAILTGMVDDQDAVTMAKKILSDTSLTQATIYFKYYVNLAIMKAIPTINYSQLLADWRNQLNAGLSTWAEISDIQKSRSDCHAWGASPSIELLRFVVGIQSDSPGFETILIAPQPGNLNYFFGSVPHHRGLIHVEGFKKGSHWKFNILTPLGVQSRLLWNGVSYPIHSGRLQGYFL